METKKYQRAKLWLVISIVVSFVLFLTAQFVAKDLIYLIELLLIAMNLCAFYLLNMKVDKSNLDGFTSNRLFTLYNTLFAISLFFTAMIAIDGLALENFI